MATHSSILAWRIPWTEEPGGLQSMGPQRVGLDCVCVHVQHKGKPESCLVSDTILRHPLLQLTSLQDFSYTLPQKGPLPSPSVQKGKSFRVTINTAEQFCT